MKILLNFLSVCLLFVLPLALAKTDNAPGPHSTDNSSIAQTAQATADVPTPLDHHHSNHYEWMIIQGFWVQVRFPEEMDLDMIEDYTETLDLLNRQLKRAKGVLPETAISKLQTKTYIFIKDDCTDGGSVSYWRDEDSSEHGWITLHCFQYLQNVLDDAYSGAETVHGRQVWGHPGIILHELAHSWHDQFVDGGFGNNMVEEFYDHAVDCLGTSDPGDEPYYWESDKEEFFADFSVMYYLSHWDPPGRVWNMQKKYRVLVIRLWNEVVYEGWEDQLNSCGT